MSQYVFNKIDEYFSNKYKTYFATKNGEFGKLTSIGYKKIDYYIAEEKIAIEYNGEIFHAGKNFEDEDKPNPWSEETAFEIRNNDRERYQVLFDEFNIRTFVIWENELDTNHNFSILIDNIQNFINNKNIKTNYNL